MAKAKKSDTSKKVFDVSKPGSTIASPTSKPAIVGHSSGMSDPMVKDDLGSKTDEAKPTQSEEAPTQAKKTITPPDESVAAADQQPDVSEKEAPSEGSTPAPEQADEKPAADSADDQEATKANDPATKALEQAAKDKAAEEKLHARQKRVAELVGSKEYFIPVGASHGGSLRTVLLMLVVFVVVLVVGVLLIDAGVIFSDVNLPFDLTSN